MRVLVTGGAGFLGSHLCDLLIARGHTVVCLDDLSTGCRINIEHLGNSPKFSFIEASVLETVDIRGRFEGVVHLASPASPSAYLDRPIFTLRTGSEGTRNVLEFAVAKSARFILASTSEVYGEPLLHPQPEEYWGNVNPIGIRSCYDEGKRCAETLFFDYWRQHRLPIKVARIFNTYGPRMQPGDGRVVSSFIVQALKGDPITVFGDGGQTRSFCYVDDLVEGITRLMLTEEGCTGPINLGNNSEFTILELAEKVISFTGSRSKLIYKPLPQDDPRQRQPDLSKAKAVLNWEPKVALADGLKETIAYFKRSLELT